jgi:DNA-binding transcriptional LysR family regulator
MWRDVELRELRIFLVLADELHFGRTAERPSISQPGVSEAVRVLESRLGIKVFDRTSRRVRLTPAGEGLKRSLVPALAALEQALAETSELSRAVRGLLRIGFVLTTEGPALSQLIAAFHTRYPACEVRPQEVETFNAYQALRGRAVSLRTGIRPSGRRDREPGSRNTQRGSAGVRGVVRAGEGRQGRRPARPAVLPDRRSAALADPAAAGS